MSSLQLLMVLIAGLDGRLLTLSNPILGSIVARRAYCNKNIKFWYILSRFVLFLVDLGFLLVNNGKHFEESVLNLRICSRKGYIFKSIKEELGRGNQMCSRNK